MCFFKTAILGSKIIPACRWLFAMLKYLVMPPEQRLYFAWVAAVHVLIICPLAETARALLSMFLCATFSDKSVGSTMRFGYNTCQTFVGRIIKLSLAQMLWSQDVVAQSCHVMPCCYPLVQGWVRFNVPSVSPEA